MARYSVKMMTRSSVHLPPAGCWSPASRSAPWPSRPPGLMRARPIVAADRGQPARPRTALGSCCSPPRAHRLRRGRTPRRRRTPRRCPRSAASAAPSPTLAPAPTDLRASPASAERRGRGEQPLLEQLQDELGRERLGPVGGRGLAQLGVARERACAALSSSGYATSIGTSSRQGNRGVPRQSASSDFSRRTMTAASCSRSGSTPTANRWLSSSSSRAEKLSG